MLNLPPPPTGALTPQQQQQDVRSSPKMAGVGGGGYPNTAPPPAGLMSPIPAPGVAAAMQHVRGGSPIPPHPGGSPPILVGQGMPVQQMMMPGVGAVGMGVGGPADMHMQVSKRFFSVLVVLWWSY